MLASEDNFPLLAELLADQQRLQTPVSRFATAIADVPAPAVRYRELIPLGAPRPGEQYAFEVDLDRCTGCKSCVSACHSLNGLDETESWRDVGLLVGGDERRPFQQTITTACHHCADPGCLNGCPVLAYEKDPVTGIVRHLDDQCIGCQYCILKCPYDVPKYNRRLGIVRKCDMCHSRLAAGEAPACVQACPTQAIRITRVAVTAGPTRVDPTGFLAAAPSPGHTQPTTRYVSRRPLPAGLQAADAAGLRLQPAHWPLAVMLTLLPLAAGASTLSAGLAWQPGDAAALGADRATAIGWLAGAIGLTTSVAHLGRPLRAWRIFLGWRRSWLSREALVFGLWFAVATLAFALRWPEALRVWQGWTSLVDLTGDLALAVAVLSALLALVGLGCSSMIYADTPRVAWRWSLTGPRFFGSAVIAGAATALALGQWTEVSAGALVVATLLKLAGELRAIGPIEADDDAPITPALTTARLLGGPLRVVFGLRVTMALLGSALAPIAIVAGVLPPAAAAGVWVLAMAGEFVDRCLFFRAADPSKMPGLPAEAGRKGPA